MLVILYRRTGISRWLGTRNARASTAGSRVESLQCPVISVKVLSGQRQPGGFIQTERFPTSSLQDVKHRELRLETPVECEKSVEMFEQIDCQIFVVA